MESRFAHQRKFLESAYIQVQNKVLSVATVVESLSPFLTLERKQRIEEMLNQRMLKVQVILEDVVDIGNMFAIFRTIEALGFFRAHVIDKSTYRKKISNRSARRAEKWLDVREWSSEKSCAEALKKDGVRIITSSVRATKSIEEIDFSKPCALVFGNERFGVASEFHNLEDDCFKIPMQGFSESMNVSVAAGMCLYEASRQLSKVGKLSGDLESSQKDYWRAHHYLKSLRAPERYLVNVASEFRDQNVENLSLKG